MALQVDQLGVHLGSRAVLQEVSLQVEAGQFLAVIGPNGSGKTTLLRAISGLVRPQQGQISWDGNALPSARAARAKLVALLPQNAAGDEDMTLEEATFLGRTAHMPPYGVPSKRDALAVETAISLVAPDLKNRKVGALSGGERQRALLCRAIATQAPILLLDEPVSALDVRYQHEILALIRQLTRERHLSTICVLHGINLAASVADSMVLLGQNGQIVASGPPTDVMTDEHLSSVYEMPLRVAPHPVSGRPQAQSWWEW